ncbi:MAG: hypothetical protein ACK56I_22940, partial [bacterium]
MPAAGAPSVGISSAGLGVLPGLLMRLPTQCGSAALLRQSLFLRTSLSLCRRQFAHSSCSAMID